MGNDNVQAQSKVEHCRNIITEIPRPDHAYMTQMYANIVYYVANFISKSVKKEVICVAYGDILGENSALVINIEGTIPENC